MKKLPPEEALARQRARAREYYHKNKQACAERGRIYRLANKEKCDAWRADWEQRNPEKQRAIERKHRHRKMADPVRRLARRMRERVKDGLVAGRRAGSFVALFGYTIDDLRRHIERQFLRGMSWENRHLWHVDHIVPLAHFGCDSVDHPDFRMAWALTNLRPLWAAENIAKGAKRLTLL